MNDKKDKKDKKVLFDESTLVLFDEYRTKERKLSSVEEEKLSSFLANCIANRDLNQYLINNEAALINKLKISPNTTLFVIKLCFETRADFKDEFDKEKILAAYKQVKAGLPLKDGDRLSLKVVSILWGLHGLDEIPQEISNNPALKELNENIAISKEFFNFLGKKAFSPPSFGGFGFFNDRVDAESMKYSANSILNIFNKLSLFVEKESDHLDEKPKP